MPKQYERALLEIEVKERLERVRDELGHPSLSATIIYINAMLPCCRCDSDAHAHGDWSLKAKG